MDDDRITKHLVEPPDRQIDLQQAVEQIVIATWGPQFVIVFPPALLRDSKPPKIQDSLYAAAWEDARYCWLLGWLKADKLKYYVISKQDPHLAYAVELSFWQNSNRDYVVLQHSLLDRKEDRSEQWKSVLDLGVFLPLLTAAAEAAKRKPAPIDRMTRRRAELRGKAREKWGDEPATLPPREELRSWGRNEVAANVTWEDARWLRKELAPSKIKRGGAGMHRQRPVKQSKI